MYIYSHRRCRYRFFFARKYIQNKIVVKFQYTNSTNTRYGANLYMHAKAKTARPPPKNIFTKQDSRETNQLSAHKATRCNPASVSWHRAVIPRYWCGMMRLLLFGMVLHIKHGRARAEQLSSAANCTRRWHTRSIRRAASAWSPIWINSLANIYKWCRKTCAMRDWNIAVADTQMCCQTNCLAANRTNQCVDATRALAPKVEGRLKDFGVGVLWVVWRARAGGSK